jgi:prepilin-type N-terminal cleavage/methylation domain
MHKQQGFTLIELLVSISIIGILFAMITVNLVSMQQRGRDATRKNDPAALQAALELYYAYQQ